MYVCLRRRSIAFSLTHVFSLSASKAYPPKKDMNGKKGKLRARKYFWPKKCPILLFLSLSFPPLFPMAFLRAFYGEHDERRGGLYFPLTTPSLLFSSLFSQICTTADKTKINLFRLPTKPPPGFASHAKAAGGGNWHKRKMEKEKKRKRKKRIWLVLHSTFVVAPPIPPSSISCLFYASRERNGNGKGEKKTLFSYGKTSFLLPRSSKKAHLFRLSSPSPFRHIRKSWLNTENQGRGEKEGGERGIWVRVRWEEGKGGGDKLIAMIA